MTGKTWVKRGRAHILFVALAAVFALFCSRATASSLPFRAVAPGDDLPPLSFKPLDDGADLETGSLKGNPLALLFWGADVETKKDRSIKAFKAVESILPYLEERKVRVLLVNAQGDEKTVMQAAAEGVSGKLPFYLDPSQKAYGDLGLFIVPSVMLVDAGGKIVSGLGYSHDFAGRLKGEVQIMLGEKNRAEVERELRPEMVEKSDEEKQSVRYFNAAMVMLRRGQTDSAVAELNKALEADPKMGEAHGQLGCLYLDMGQLAEAKKSLDASYGINPDYLPANICDARVRAEEGQVDDAVDDLKALLFRNARKPGLHFALAGLYEKQQKYADAAAEYRKAYELASKFSVSE